MFWGIALLGLGLAGLFASSQMDEQRAAMASPADCLISDVQWQAGGLAQDSPWVRFEDVAPRCVGAMALVNYTRAGVVVHQSVVRLAAGVTDRGAPVRTTDVTWGILAAS